jgi:hypothetical protein
MGRHDVGPGLGSVVRSRGVIGPTHDGQHQAPDEEHPPPRPSDVSPAASFAPVRVRAVPALWGATGSLAAAAMALVLISGQQGLGYLLVQPPQGSGPSDPGVRDVGEGAADPAISEDGRQFSPDDGGWVRVGEAPGSTR